jgi:hypothetical protein
MATAPGSQVRGFHSPREFRGQTFAMALSQAFDPVVAQSAQIINALLTKSSSIFRTVALEVILKTGVRTRRWLKIDPLLICARRS